MPSLPPPNPYIAGMALGSQRGFFGREDILREVERTLRRPADNAIVLYGQRRIGKTSVLLQLQRRLPQPSFVPIYFDLMDKARLPVSQVLYELALTTANEVGLPPLQRADFADNPEAFHRLFLPKLYQALGEECRPVFLLDEFDVLDLADERELPEMAAARAFRSHLRRLMTAEPRLAFVVVFGRRMEELSVEFLSTFKAALARSLSVLRPEAARMLILQTEHEVALRYEEAAVERILALTRGHPYLTQLTCQLLFDHAYDLATNEIPIITVTDVEAAIPRVLETGSHAFEWIWDGLPPAERIIFSAIASRAEEGDIFSEDAISAVLQSAGIRILMRELNLAPQTLVEWQMLEQVDGGYRFFVELMRRWVAAHRPLDKVKDELDRLNPLADTLHQAAQGFYRQGNLEEAMTALRQALATNPNHLKARLLLGTILREEGHLVEAIAEFEEAYRLEEREGRFELLRTLLQQGETLEMAGDEEGALAAYERVLAVSPHEQTAQASRTAIWEKRGDQALAGSDFEVAIEAYRQARADKKVAQVREQQFRLELKQAAEEALTYERQEEWTNAAEVYHRLTELDPDNRQWEQALRRVQEELSLAEQYAEGAGYVQQEDWEKAKKILASVIHRRADYRNAAELLDVATKRGKGQPDPRHKWLQYLVWIVGGSIFLLLLTMIGLYSYSKNQVQIEVTRLAATAMAQITNIEATATIRLAATVAAQATSVENAAATRLASTLAAQATMVDINAATQVIVAVQSTQLASLHATETAAAEATAAVEARPTFTPTPTFTLTPSPTPTPTSSPTSTPTPTFSPTTVSVDNDGSGECSSDCKYADAPILISPERGEDVSKFSTLSWEWVGPPLEANEYFDVRIFESQSAAEALHVIPVVNATSVKVGIDELKCDRKYLWSVRVAYAESVNPNRWGGGYAISGFLGTRSPESERRLFRSDQGCQ